jgi:hypothetical protein
MQLVSSATFHSSSCETSLAACLRTNQIQDCSNLLQYRHWFCSFLISLILFLCTPHLALFAPPLEVNFYVKVATKDSLMVSALSVFMDLSSGILCPFITDILHVLPLTYLFTEIFEEYLYWVEYMVV